MWSSSSATYTNCIASNPPCQLCVSEKTNWDQSHYLFHCEPLYLHYPQSRPLENPQIYVSCLVLLFYRITLSTFLLTDSPLAYTISECGSSGSENTDFSPRSELNPVYLPLPVYLKRPCHYRLQTLVIFPDSVSLAATSFRQLSAERITPPTFEGSLNLLPTLAGSSRTAHRLQRI